MVKVLVWFVVGFAFLALASVGMLRPDPNKVVAMIRSFSADADPATVRAVEQALLGF